jgi:ectoine hydroxylase-related dioxygenase (phytanoyl-CoA dioxygenase family)
VILSDSEVYNAFKMRVEMDGFAVIPECLDETTVELLGEQFDDTRDRERNLLSVARVRDLAASKHVRRIMEAILGPKCFAVRGIFFNKTRSSNWKVVWHQDLTIAVRQRADASGFGPWTTKAGILHVQPPADVMSGILAIRLHLDESAIENGPLRVLPGSHRNGRLTAEQIANWNKEGAITCTVPKGGALVMRPLILHASSSCAVPNSRRVLHLEFAATELPHGLNWHDRISPEDLNSNQ